LKTENKSDNDKRIITVLQSNHSITQLKGPHKLYKNNHFNINLIDKF